MAVVLSAFIFFITLTSRLNGGKISGVSPFQFIENAFTAIASGSGIKDVYRVVCLFMREAKRSIVGVTSSSLRASCNSSGFNCHSVSIFILQLASSASTLSYPGIKNAVMWICLVIHHSHTCFVSVFSLLSLLEPILLIQLTADMLSSLSSMWALRMLFAYILSPKKDAISSNSLM